MGKHSRKPRSPRGLPVNGELLRFLRNAHGYSQERAASLADVSDKLIRKAESGGPIQASSIRALANLYAQPLEILLTRSPETTSSPSSGQLPASARLLRQLLHHQWHDQQRVEIEQMFSNDVVGHCEEGVLHGRSAWLERYQDHPSPTTESMLVLEQIAGNQQTATGRWLLLWQDEFPAHPVRSRPGSTMIRIEHDTIVEIWEFSDPQRDWLLGNADPVS